MVRPETSPRLDDVEARFHAEYHVFQYHFVEFFTEHLAECSRVFDGDLQEMLVLALIGQMHLKAHFELTQAGEALSMQKLEEPQITASRLADASGIPRETVRRKLVKLAGRGWIKQRENGAWHLVLDEDNAAARRDLEGLDKRGVARVAQLYRKLSRMLA
ncbi:MAG: helix-turn-helix domain-containing protein [Proteobacteria bacterium]|nr:helix-turn-helix domain-containing protein [Pseudomonadota bacterium]